MPSHSSPSHSSPVRIDAKNYIAEMDEIKKADEVRMSHRSTSPLTPDLPPSPGKIRSCTIFLMWEYELLSAVASPELYETDRLQPVEVEYFAEHVKNMHENRDKRFEREYKVSVCVCAFLHHCSWQCLLNLMVW